jgi:hypothetical protein
LLEVISTLSLESSLKNSVDNLSNLNLADRDKGGNWLVTLNVSN